MSYVVPDYDLEVTNGFRNFVRTDCGHRAAEAEAEDGAEDRCAASGAEDETENRIYKPVFPPANSQDYSGYKFLLDQVLRREFRFLSQEHEEMICSLFNFLDKTGDSKLDINDFKGEAVPDENARMGVLWTFLQKYYDLNEDNEITRDEFMKCFILEALLKDMKPMEHHMVLYDQLLYIKASFDEALGEIIEEKKTMFEKAGTNKLHNHKEEITRNRRNSLPNTFGKLKDEQIRPLNIKVDPEFTKNIDNILEKALYAKFTQIDELKLLLINTKNAKLLNFQIGNNPIQADDLMKIRSRIIS